MRGSAGQCRAEPVTTRDREREREGERALILFVSLSIDLKQPERTASTCVNECALPTASRSFFYFGFCTASKLAELWKSGRSTQCDQKKTQATLLVLFELLLVGIGARLVKGHDGNRLVLFHGNRTLAHILEASVHLQAVHYPNTGRLMGLVRTPSICHLLKPSKAQPNTIQHPSVVNWTLIWLQAFNHICQRLFVTEFEDGKLWLVALVRPPFVIPAWMRPAYTFIFGVVIIQNRMSRVQASMPGTKVPGNI